MYQKRMTAVFTAFLLILCLTGARLSALAVGAGTAKQSGRGSGGYTLTVDSPRGTIFDRKLEPLTNRESVYRAVLTATPQVMTAIYDCFSTARADEIAQQLRTGKPVLVSVPSGFGAPAGATLFCCREQSPAYQPAVQLMGYLDSEGKTGVCGLQKSFDSLLCSDGDTTVSFSCSATGGVLLGVEPEISLNGSRYDSGLVTTLDADIQILCDTALDGVDKGAAVVLDAGSGDILALSSAPDFSPSDLSGALENSRSPMLERALMAYDLGSVFKLCVASAALESGISSALTYSCTGSISMGETFACHQKEGHGTLDMRAALADSCNPYFIHLAAEAGGDAVYDMAVQLGLSAPLSLCAGVESAAGSLPDKAAVSKIPAELGNFAIGQGNVTVTPLQVAALVGTIANGGVYFPPRLIAGTQNPDGSLTCEKASAGRRVLSASVAEQVQDMMAAVIAQGTGRAAAPDTGLAGGKTATAQTGWRNPDGTPGDNAWFAGYYQPDNGKKYAVAVLVEGGVSGSVSAAPVFRQICNGIARLTPESH